MFGLIAEIELLIPAIVLIITVDFLIGFVIIKRVRDSFDTAIRNRIESDRLKTVDRIKFANLEKEKKNIFSRYTMFIQGLLINLNIFFTVENFTSILLAVYILFVTVFTVLTGELLLGSIIGVPLIVLIVSTMVQLSRLKNTGKVDKIMDAEDIICPMINLGVPGAISKALPSIDASIRPYYENFLMQYQLQGYTLNEALDNLAISLGPTAIRFIEKAKIYHYDEREGMISIFNDIIDDNALRREINSKKDFAFKAINRSLIYKIGIVGLFLLYLFSEEATRTFLLENTFGRILLAVTFILFSVIYAINQKIQSDIELD